MKVSLTSRGGHMAGLNMSRPPQVINTDDLSASDAQRLMRLAEQAKTAGGAAPTGGGLRGDAMSYTIELQDGDDKTVLSATDDSMGGAFGDLFDFLQRRMTR